MPSSHAQIQRIRRLARVWLCSCVLPIAAVTAVLMSGPGLIQAQQEGEVTVADIRIEGNQTIPESVILQKIQAQPQRPISERLIREDIRSLMSTRWFFNVKERLDETPDGLILVYTVHEKPIVQRVEFRGNNKVKVKHLKAWTGLKAGSPFDARANTEAVNRIEREYKDKGYYFVKVSLLKGGNPGDREVVFQIAEGPKVQVKDRTFEGNRFWSNGDLRKNLISKEAFLIFGGIYNPDTIPADIEALKQFYRNVGFFDVEVTGKPLFSRDRSDVNLHFVVTEGRRYKVREIRYEGNATIATNRLKTESKLNNGEYYSAYPLAKDVRRMLGYYGEKGHFFATVTPVPHFTEQPGIVDLVFEIDEDRPRYVRDINVSYEGDHPHTKQTVALDRLQIQPGDLADPFLINRGRSRLNGSQLFEPGIGFEFLPVEPGESGFSADSRTYRAQGPPSSRDSWTQEFSIATQRSAFQSANEDYEWLTRRDETAAANVGETGVQVAPGARQGRNLVPPVQDARTAIRNRTGDTEERQTKPTRPRYQREPRPISTPPADSDHNVAHPVYESDLMEFRPVTPTSFFSIEPAAFETSQNFESDEPIIRAQSPDATPERTDAILDGSPYQGQFREVQPGWLDINVNAAEGRTGRLMFGAGVNSNSGLVGSFVWDESNFDILRPPTSFSDIIEGRAWRGGGQRFRVEAAPGNQVSRYAVSWTDPYFLYTDYSLGVSGFYFNRFYPNWTEDRYGGRVSIGKQFTPEWSGSLALRLEEVEMRNPSPTEPASVTPFIGSNFLSTLRTSVTHDTRDSSMMPTEGHYLDGGYEQAFGEFTFPKVEVDARQYFTMYNRPDGTGRHVLTVAGNLGVSGNDTPTFERYFAGGFQSFRGFAYRGVTPRTGGFSTGGTFQALGTVEYRIPVTADDMINVVAFSDFGTVDDSVSLDKFRASVGFGFRVVIPAMGPVPLAFDFAFPVLKEDIDNQRIFSFYVGINR
ncbi:MAG: BamA/TamA family outer membrane protein [Fuerstia sp.]|nr:BamA/TamA family outer membrane protein [Fuerstiella sp.]